MLDKDLRQTKLLKRLTESIRKLNGRVETIATVGDNATEAIRENTKAQNQAHEKQPPRNPERVSAIVDFSPEQIQRSDRDYAQSHGIQRATFWVGLATLIVLGFYTYFTWQLVDVSKETLSQSRTALNATIQSSYRDQRAWVGVDSITGNVELGKPLIVTVQYRNTGKSPALKLITIASVEPVDKGKEPSFTYEPNLAGVLSSTVLQPNAIYRNILNAGGATNIAVTQVGYDRIRSGDLVVFVYGKLTYEDIFSRSHRTTFCVYLDPIGKTWNTYKGYNEVDPEPEPEPEPSR